MIFGRMKVKNGAVAKLRVSKGFLPGILFGDAYHVVGKVNACRSNTLSRDRTNQVASTTAYIQRRTSVLPASNYIQHEIISLTNDVYLFRKRGHGTFMPVGRVTREIV